MPAELLGAFPDLTPGNVAMICIALGMVYLGVSKRYEPLLLLPIGLGVMLANLPSTGIADDDGFLGLLRRAGLDNELFPLLMFLGVGALTDFTPMLQRPVTVLLGAAAQVGIFAALLAALFLGWGLDNAGAIGIIGSADGPTTIFVSTQLADVDLWGPIAVAAYSYMAMVPLIQPPIMRLVTTRKERMVRMPYPSQTASFKARVFFPIIVIILGSLIAPKAAPLIGMLMFGNLLREVGVVDRLSRAAQNELINVTTIFLGPHRGLYDDCGAVPGHPNPGHIRPGPLGIRHSHPDRRAIREGDVLRVPGPDKPADWGRRRFGGANGREGCPQGGAGGRSRQLASHARNGAKRRGSHRLRDCGRSDPGIPALTSEQRTAAIQNPFPIPAEAGIQRHSLGTAIPCGFRLSPE